ncbi:MAG: DNA translocase FtsK [Brevinematia bacterium]
MRRTVGGTLILFFIVAIASYKYYPSILTLDNVFSFLLRRFIYTLRVLGGENNVEILALALSLTFLPLLFKKPFYYFFKNLLGCELSTLGWLGIYGISNLQYPPHIIGVLTYDVAGFLVNSVGNYLGYAISFLILIFGIFLILTSYKTSSKIINLGLTALLLSLQKIFLFIKSLFEYSENNEYPEFSNRKRESNFNVSSSASGDRKFDHPYESRPRNSETEPNFSKKFIEITEIDLDTESDIHHSSSSYQPSRTRHMDIFATSSRNSETFVKEDSQKKLSEEDFKSHTVRDVEIINESKSVEETAEYTDYEEGDTTQPERKTNTTYSEGKVFSGKYPPPVELLDKPELSEVDGSEQLKEIEETKRIIQNTFSEFKIDAVIEGVIRGPVVTMYEVRPKPGTKIAKIVNISDNLALNLATSRVRIVYPIHGKSVIGIEIPNKVRKTVKIREVIESREYRDSKVKLPLVIGVDIHGKPIVEDLTQMPHLLIAGSTGSGKSVYVNSIIAGLLYARGPDELKLIMIDLKIVELKSYNSIPHLLSPVITTPNLAKTVLEWLVEEMQYRYKRLESLGCRDIHHYNNKVNKLGESNKEKLPYIVLIIDEYADLMMTSPKETEDYITRLAAMSRAVGIHLIIATQRPSVDVVTGLIKANFPARVAFRVASKVDSRTILDTIGAEKLLGKGDLLFMSPTHPTLIRVQGCFISNEEVERTVDYLIKQDSPNYIDLPSLLEVGNNYEEETDNFSDEEFSDELYNEAVKIVILEKKASASYLQRRLRIGYNRAARMIERMEEEGIVGPQQGSKPREILVDESYLEKIS